MMQPRIPATVIILTKNEARHVQRAVTSAAMFEDVLVVDSFSDDDTRTLAQEAGARVIDFEWDGGYPKKKEWALEHAKFDWVFYLDADEYFGPELVNEMSKAMNEAQVKGIEVAVRYFWMGSELKHGHQVRKRIGIRRSASSWPRPDDLIVSNMWEVEGHYQPLVVGQVAMMKSKLDHMDEDGLFEYFDRHNRYSDWEARMILSGDSVAIGARTSKGRLAARLPGKAAIFFIYSYILKRGFLDGRAGLSYATALAFYYWQIALKKDELRKMQVLNP